MSTLVIELNDVLTPTGWGGIDPQLVKSQLLTNPDADVLEIHINSPGGDYFAGAEIAEAIRAYPSKTKKAIVTGQCASAATYALIECDERWISPLGMITIHEPSTVVQGKSRDLVAVANEMDLITEALIPYYASKINASIEQVSAWIREIPDGHTFGPPDAVKFGWVKGITTSGKAEDLAPVPFTKWNAALQQTKNLLDAKLVLAKHLAMYHKKS
jgi:ATP-dependent protease ClpP protease subunit